MKRIPKQKMYRGMMRAGLITKADLPKLESRLTDPTRAKKLQNLFAANRGARFVEKLAALAQWIFLHRETIMSILGFVVLFADNGTPRLVDKDEHEAKLAEEAEKAEAERTRRRGKRKPAKKTPDGEKVEDFLDDEVPVLVTNESVISREAAEKCMDELVKMNEDAGLYDADATSKMTGLGRYDIGTNTDETETE